MTEKESSKGGMLGTVIGTLAAIAEASLSAFWVLRAEALPSIR